jgi:zinc protease
MTEVLNQPLDRSKPPTPGSVRSFEFPPVLSSALPNGLKLRIARMTRAPLVTMGIVLDAGEAPLGDDIAGLATLAGESLEGGTNRRTGMELADALEGIGSSLSIRTGWDATTISMTCLADKMEEGFSLLTEALLEPAFPPEEVDRFRTQRLAVIRQREMDPGSLADDAAAHHVYSDDSSYHRPLTGTRNSMGKLGTDQIREFAAERYRATGSGVVVVGDVEVGEVTAMVEERLGEWAGGAARVNGADISPRSGRSRVVVVDRPGAVQSEIRIGQVGVSRSTPYFFPLRIFNTVLGGAFTSRLMLNLREAKGFTYGVRSRFSYRRGPGPFGISMAVATDVTAPAVGEALRELKGILTDGLAGEEVARARDYIAGIFPLALETTAQVAARLGEIQIYDLPDGFFRTYRDEIRSVTAEDALEAGRAVIRPEELTVVVVADAAAVQGPLEGLELGPVEIVPVS